MTMFHLCHNFEKAFDEGLGKEVRRLLARCITHKSWPKGYELLCEALQDEKIEIAKLLLSLGCEVTSDKENSDTPLILAIRDKSSVDKTLVTALLEKGALINASDSEGRTALHEAAASNEFSVVELLISKGASVNVSDNCGDTPLHFAARSSFKANESDNCETVKFLVSKGAKVNALNDRKQTPLNLAFSNEKAVWFLIESGATVAHKDKFGDTALHQAVDRNYFEIVELLLRKSVDVNAQMQNNNITPIYIAVKNKNYKISELLLKFQADPDISDSASNFPLFLAVSADCRELTELLLKGNADVNKKNADSLSSLYASARNGNEELFALLLRYKAEVDIHMKEGSRTILHHAIFNGCPLIVEHVLKHCNIQEVAEDFNELLKAAMLKRGKNYFNVVKQLVSYGFHLRVNEIDNGEVILAVIKYGYLEVFEDLLHFGVDINMKLMHNHYEWNPLFVAVNYKQIEITELLISRGSDLNITDNFGDSPLFYAVKKGCSEIFQLIIQKVDVKCYSKPFNLAVWMGSLEIVSIFIEKGYDINLRDDLGRISLHYTADGGDFCEDSNESDRVKVVKLLVSSGADINATMKSGVTTFHAAVKNNYSKVVEALLQCNVDINCKLEGSLSYKPFLSVRGFQEKCIDTNKVPYCYALHIAVAEIACETVELLLRHGAMVDCKNGRDLTPLHIAASLGNKEGNLKNLKQLLSYDADVYYDDDNGRTPLLLAAICTNDSFAEIFKLLLDHGSDIDEMDNHNRTLFDYIRRGLLRHDWQKESEIFEFDDPDSKEFEKSAHDYHFDKEEDIAHEDHFDVGNDDFLDAGDYIDFENSEAPQRAMIEYLQQHAIKLKVADLTIDEEDLNLPVVQRIPNFRERCEMEIVTMQSEYIGDTSVSLFDVFSCESNQLLTYMKNERFFNVLEEKNVLKNYPIYCGLLESILMRAKNRRKLLDESSTTFYQVLPYLPEPCWAKIVNHLSNEDLRKVCIALCNAFAQ